jgi:hypothetical protein
MRTRGRSMGHTAAALSQRGRQHELRNCLFRDDPDFDRKSLEQTF